MPKLGFLSVPAPLDEGVGTVCFKVTVPNSYDWIETFYTSIGTMRRGRTWKDREGDSVLGAMGHGLSIWESIELCGEDSGSTVEIIEIINQIVNNAHVCCCKECCNMSCCCGGNSSTDTNTETVPDNVFPDEVLPSPEQLPTDTPIDTQFDDWKCRWGKHMPLMLIASLEGMRDLVEVGEANYATSDELVTATLYSLLGGVPAFLFEFLLAVVTNSVAFFSPIVAAPMINRINAVYEQLTNIAYCASDAQEAADGWYSLLVTEATYSHTQKSLMRLWLRLVNFESLFDDALTRMNAPAYTYMIETYTSDCSCSADGGDIGLPAGYVTTPMLVKLFTPENGGSVSSVGNDWQIIGQGNSFGDITIEEPVYEGVIVPLAARVGFHISLEYEELQNAVGSGHRVANTSTQISQHGFGGIVGDWVVGDVFAGAVTTEAPLQTWLTDNAFKQIDSVTTITNTGRVVWSFGFFGGTTNTGLPNTIIVECDMIIKLSEL